jgi:hypothetical protein
VSAPINSRVGARFDGRRIDPASMDITLLAKVFGQELAPESRSSRVHCQNHEVAIRGSPDLLDRSTGWNGPSFLMARWRSHLRSYEPDGTIGTEYILLGLLAAPDDEPGQTLLRKLRTMPLIAQASDRAAA